MITANTRKCNFTDFVQVLEQIERLEQTQFVETTGVWSYYQILKHCTEHIQFSMTGFPYTYNPVLRKTVGKYLLSKMLERGFMFPDGYSGQIETVRIEGDDKVALMKLKSAIYSFRRFNREFAIHPLYDEMDKPTWEKFHSIHIANHLSFVEAFPLSMEFTEDIEEINFRETRNLSTSPLKSINSLRKLESGNGIIGDRKTKRKIKPLLKKRKR